jgi:hypothetical protein
MSTVLEQRQRVIVNRDDVLNAIAAWIHEARQAKMPPEKCFPKYMYVNTEVWEDEIGPALQERNDKGIVTSNLLDDMQIEVRHHPLMPPDRFSFTADPYPVDEVAKHLRQYEALPLRA